MGDVCQLRQLTSDADERAGGIVTVWIPGWTGSSRLRTSDKYFGNMPKYVKRADKQYMRHYLFQYNCEIDVGTLGTHLAEKLAQFPADGVQIRAHSMGGLVFAAALGGARVSEVVQNVVFYDCPFGGVDMSLIGAAAELALRASSDITDFGSACLAIGLSMAAGIGVGLAYVKLTERWLLLQVLSDKERLHDLRTAIDVFAANRFVVSYSLDDHKLFPLVRIPTVKKYFGPRFIDRMPRDDNLPIMNRIGDFVDSISDGVLHLPKVMFSNQSQSIHNALFALCSAPSRSRRRQASRLVEENIATHGGRMDTVA
eukprot:m.15557 g.15557  ORF g.15557 m.15557 type:complete len:313 (-) comp8696_c0_seq2:52-990(-)